MSTTIETKEVNEENPEDSEDLSRQPTPSNNDQQQQQLNEKQNKGKKNGSRGHDNNCDRRNGGGYFHISKANLIFRAPNIDLSFKERTLESEKKFTGRCRLFVANLPSNVTEESLRALFEEYGEISEIFLRQKNAYAFIKMDTRAHAKAARQALDLKNYQGRTLRVRLAAHTAALRVMSVYHMIVGFFLKKIHSSSSTSPSSQTFCDQEPDGILSENLPYIDKEPSTTTERESVIESTICKPSFNQSETHCQQPYVTIYLKPDNEGKFGFNVKGGVDQNCPVLVSRVAPNTPAGNSSPKLNEGDQVVAINGQDVSNLSHKQIVDLIRSTTEQDPPELTLTIKPLLYNGDDSDEDLESERVLEYIPENVSPQSRCRVRKCDELCLSIMLLDEGLASDGLAAQYDRLYRYKPGESIYASTLPENRHKNRYRDIAPYDSTRVILRESQTGDYINASHINMEIPKSGILNRYIATQGPLASTCEDFWQMVWEQKSPLIVMVTPLVERGSVKCHKYWPDLNEKQNCGHLSVSCTNQNSSSAMIEREFLISDKGESRIVHHLQYTAWPDHGVPDDASDFLSLVFRVRKYREGTVEPIIVHCSAGIGRTGVLIMMETAMCLIEANQPVYPIDLLKTMRDQRGGLIQTLTQFKFVCSAIHKIYTEKIVAPLKEYKT